MAAQLSRVSLRLPWAVIALFFTLTVPFAYFYLPEPLPKAERVPFRWYRPVSMLSSLLHPPLGWAGDSARQPAGERLVLSADL